MTEVLISLVIVAIMGGCAVAAMFAFIASRNQVDDYATADIELEYAVQRLAREFALIGLGMPNNRQAYGSFALLHRVADDSDWPAAAYFGAADSPWGGPVTVSDSAPYGEPDGEPVPIDPDADGVYVGPELFYAWAVPTGVNARLDRAGNQVGNNDPLVLELITDGGVEKLEAARWDTRNIWSAGGSTAATSAWLTMPTLRLPLFTENFDRAAKTLSVRAAPVPNEVIGSMTVSRTAMSLDEIHITQAARLHLQNGRLVRSVFGNGLNAQDETLVDNVVALHFAYDPDNRLLSMFIALQGREAHAAGASAIRYPAWIPNSARIHGSLGFRIVAKTLTWRIRN